MTFKKGKLTIALSVSLAVFCVFTFMGLNADLSNATPDDESTTPSTETSTEAATDATDDGAAAVNKGNELKTDSGGGEIDITAQGEGDVTGTVTADTGYDVASVRYVFSDGTYGFAELTKTADRTYTYSYPAQEKPVVEVKTEQFSTTKWDGAIDISWYDSSKDSFNISTPAQLAGLAALVNGSYDSYSNGTKDYQIKGDKALIQSDKSENESLTGAQGGNVSDIVYFGKQEMDFSGKTVTLTADMNMGGVKAADGTWSGKSWTPIGGSYPMDTTGTAAETANKDIHLIESHFNGVLDGDGHKITNLYCDRYTAKGFAYSQYIGLVGNLGGIRDGQNEDEWLSAWVPTVKNLSLDGYVYGRRMVAGIVGGVGNPPNGILIENCANHANVKNTDSKGVGGIVGAGYGTGNIINCYNTGDIYSGYAYAGGICANNDGINIYGCYNAGNIYGEDNKGRAIGGHDSGTYTVDNCYYLEGCDNDPNSNGWYEGTATRIFINVLSATESQLRNQVNLTDAKGNSLNKKILEALNNNGTAYVKDNSINNGYPILWFEASNCDSNTYNVSIANSDKGQISASKTGSLKAGTVVKLSNEADPGYILDAYIANKGESNETKLVGAYYTVGSADVTLTGDFIKLKTGTVDFVNDDKDWTISADKSGLLIDGSGAHDVLDSQVLEGDSLYQNDKLNVEAVLDEDAQPGELGQEYTGNFEFKFIYKNKDSQEEIKSDTVTSNGNKVSYTVAAEIDDAVLQIEATPETQTKSWANLVDTTWYDDNEDADSYSIGSAEELAGLAYLVNKEGVTFDGKTIKLEKNISLKNADGTASNRLWQGIGSSEEKAFEGTFDGNSKTIFNMEAISTGSYSGLFKYCVGATIENVTVRGKSEAQGGAAGIVGFMNGGKVSNCISDVEVSSSSLTSEQKTSYHDNAAGIAACTENGAEISDCINIETITGADGVGGIVGVSKGNSDTISDCYNYGMVNGNSNDSIGTGGIIGQNSGTIIGSANYASVRSSNWYTGGIVGYTIGNSQIYDSYNRGDVYSTSSYNNAAVGGIVGRSQFIIMSNAFNAGKVRYSTGCTNSKMYGSICGSFNTNINNKINYTYWDNSTCTKAIDASTSYVSIASKTTGEMKATGFIDLFNAKFGSTDSKRKLLAVSGDYPEFTGVRNLNTCTITYTGKLQGQTQKVYSGGSISLPEPGVEDKWYEYEFTSDGDAWDGENITSDMTVNVTKKVATFTATFKIKTDTGETKTLEEKNFSYDPEGDDAELPSVEAPSLETYRRTGYTVKWPAYELDAADITIKAVYKQKIVKGGEEELSGTDGNYFFIGAKSSGLITIAEDAVVTLDGRNGYCNNLRIVMNDGSKLTLKNVELGSEESVLTVGEGCTVVLEGDNILKGRCTEQTDSGDPLHATIDVNGNCSFEGEGLTYVTSAKDNSCMDVAEGKTYTHKSGTIEFYKDDRLGKKTAGGAIEAETAIITIEGGTFASAVNNDGLYAINVGTLNISGGQTLFATEEDHSGKAVLAEDINMTGGSMQAWTEYLDATGDYRSQLPKTTLLNEEAIECRSFTDDYYVCAVKLPDTETTHTIKVDGVEYYQGNGLDIVYDNKEFKQQNDQYVYLWLANGEHSVTVDDGEAMTITKEASELGYSKTEADGKIKLNFTKPFEKAWIVFYNANGNKIDIEKKTATNIISIDSQNAKNDTKTIKVFTFTDVKKLIPAMKSYTYTL